MSDEMKDYFEAADHMKGAASNLQRAISKLMAEDSADKRTIPKDFRDEDGNPADLSKENIKRLTDIHLLRYRTMLEAAACGATHLRVDELQHYLEIWKVIALADYDWGKLERKHQQEIYDAITSGE
jgi:hypothetical protein